MRFGAHLPLIEFDGAPFGPSPLRAYVDAAVDAGFAAVSANDHLVFRRPWLDGIVALASVLERTRDLTVATTIGLPVVRGPMALAKTAAALQILSGDRFVLGVGPGSSADDYRLAGVPFEERWPRFDEAVRVLRRELRDAPTLEPAPTQPVPIWIGSWGSDAGLRRVARLGDGWLASAYNTTPEQIAAGRDILGLALPISLATAWTYLTDSRSDARAQLELLAATLGRDPDQLANRVFFGDAEECAARLSGYAEAGVDTTFVWPLGDPVEQLRRFGADVLPLLG